ncbi:hypothetical protein pb186bvf_015944 [Paramecium bursaria]
MKNIQVMIIINDNLNGECSNLNLTDLYTARTIDECRSSSTVQIILTYNMFIMSSNILEQIWDCYII